MDNNKRLIWLGGQLVPVTEAKVNVLSPTSQFGANVFEGIRCYWNADEQQLYAFRLDDHYRRLHQSIKLMRFNSPYSTEDFRQGLIDVVKANGYREDIAVRQTVFIDGLGGTWSSREPVNMFIAPIPKGRTLAEGKKGLRCQVSSWERISDRDLSPRAKVGANYPRDGTPLERDGILHRGICDVEEEPRNARKSLRNSWNMKRLPFPFH